MDSGQLVEFIDNSRFTMAMCTQVKGERIAALTQHGREINIGISRLIHVSEERFSLNLSREEIGRLLQDRSTLRDRLRKDLNIEELWELVQGDGESYGVTFLAEIVFGAGCSPDHEAALVRAVVDDSYYFKYRDGKVFPHTPEKVEQIRLQREQEAKQELELQEGARWLKSVWEKSDEHEQVPEEKRQLIEALKQVSLGDKTLPLFKWGTDLLQRAGLEGANKSFETLVKLGVWKPDENLDLIRNNIPVVYADEVMNATHLAVSENRTDRDKGRRVDLTDEFVITIDGPATRDFDDALSLTVTDDGFRLGIHIADVAAHVDKDSVLDLQARERATSIYLPDDRIPMFPQEICDHLCSLWEGQERLALSLVVNLDKEGVVVDYSFMPSVIKVGRRMTYQEVDLLAGREQMLDHLKRLALTFLKNRVEKGAIPQPPFEIALSVDPQGEVNVRRIERDSISRTIVSESMILANQLVARFLKEHNFPCIFRCQEEPEERLSGDFDSDPFLMFQQRRYLKRMIIDTVPAAHSSLGVEFYTHMTSPIRRYLDLVMQRQITSVLTREQPAYSEDELKRIVMEVGPTLRKISEVRQRRFRYWMLRHFEHLTGGTQQALVLRKFSKYFRILLTDYMMECNLQQPHKVSLSPGDYVLVRVEQANARDDVLRIRLI